MRFQHDVRIGQTVGNAGRNDLDDVQTVQRLINAHLPVPLARLTVDGICGPLTLRAIREVQIRFANLALPDGRIDPHGPTLHALLSLERVRPIIHARAHNAVAPVRTPAVHPGVGRSANPGAARPPHADVIPGGSGPFTNEVVAAAQEAQRSGRIPASVTLAQWALESNFGHAMPPSSSNPFGIKARDGEPYVEAMTSEHLNGHDVRIQARFRKFDSLAQAFERHNHLLVTSRYYQTARSKLPDPDKFADALTGVYATDPRYGEKLKTLMRRYDLYRYNQTGAGNADYARRLLLM